MTNLFTAVIDGKYHGAHPTELQALDHLRPVIRPGQIAKIYYEHPHSHLIAELSYEDIRKATS